MTAAANDSTYRGMRRALVLIALVGLAACSRPPLRQPTATAPPPLPLPPTVAPTAAPTWTLPATSTLPPTLAATSEPAPPPSQVISPSSADHVTLLAQLGRGALSQLSWSPAGDRLAVASSLGLGVYDAISLA